MSDWREAQEAQDDGGPPRSQADGLSEDGVAAMQGDVGREESDPKDAPEQVDEGGATHSPGQANDSQNLVTIRPKKSPEHLPNVEAEGKIVDLDEGQQEGKVKPPPGVHPGGPERGW